MDEHDTGVHGRVSLRVSRHDPHNIEVRSILELTAPRAVGSTEVFVFVPKSMHLAAFPKDALLGDFRSRVRLAVPIFTDPMRGADGEPALGAALEEVRRSAALARAPRWDGEEADDAAAVEAANRIVAVAGATLGAYGRRHRDEVFYGQSLLCRNREMTLSRLIDSITALGAWLGQVRALLPVDGERRGPVFRLLDEYLSHVYVQYLGQVRRQLDGPVPAPRATPSSGSGTAPVELDPVWARLGAALERLQTAEVEHRRAGGYDLKADATAEEQERHLVRLSQMKKFFQSAMLVDVAHQQVNRRVSEPAAAVAAGLAALWAAFFQGLGPQKFSSIGMSGSAVLSLGVVAYILKDRIKDWSKGFFSRKLSRRLFLADTEQKLLVGDDEIGAAKQWLAVGGPSGTPEEVRAHRRRACLSEVEREMPEDVISFRQYRDLRASASIKARFGSAWGVQETLRINLERYLKNMDDAYKTVTRLAPDGKLEEATYHRVYPFYVVVRSRHSVCHHPFAVRWRKSPRVLPVSPPTRLRARRAEERWWSPIASEERVYRVILDKNGVDRIEAVSSN